MSLGGREFMEQIRSLQGMPRERAVRVAFESGHVPSWQRATCPVTVKRGGHTLVYRVTPDYLCVGGDDDWVRVPMRPGTAQRIADRMGCTLLTQTMVDDVWKQGARRLPQLGLTSKMLDARGLDMQDSGSFLWHHDLVQEAGGRLARPGELVVGHKKDVVLSNALASKPDNVAIYGWHGLDEKVAQPFYANHGNYWVDYSHGIRLASLVGEIDGRACNLLDVAKDRELYPLLRGTDGPLKFLRYPVS